MNYSYGNQQQNRFQTQSLQNYTQQTQQTQPTQSYHSFNAPDNTMTGQNMSSQPSSQIPNNISHLYQSPYSQQPTSNSFSNTLFQREHNVHIERQYHDRYRPIYQNKISKQELNQIYENLNESRRQETPNQPLQQKKMMPQITVNRQPDFFMNTPPTQTTAPQLSMQQQYSGSMSTPQSYQQSTQTVSHQPIFKQSSAIPPQQSAMPPQQPAIPPQEQHQLSLDRARVQFVKKQKQEEIKFIDKQQKEYTQFKEKQSEKRMQYEKELHDFKLLGINAYEVLRISNDYNFESLRKAYKRQVMIHHPDKGGDPKHFDAITKSYIYLIEELRKQKGGNSQQTSQQTAKKIKEVQTVPKVNQVSMSVNEGGQFNQQMFNQLYQKNKLESVDDKGYETWLKDTKKSQQTGIQEPESFSESFSVSKFNDIFDHTKNKNQDSCQKIIEYKDPVGVSLKTGISGEELGKQDINDFSNDNPSSQLQFTDLKKAHTETNLINVNSVKQHNYAKNVKQLQHQRSNLQFVMTPQEKQRQQQIAQEKQQQEQERLKRLRNRDYQISEKFKELNGHLLQ